MKKSGILFLALWIGLLGCQPSQDAEFEKYLEEIIEKCHIVLSPKDNGEGFDVIENLKGPPMISMKILISAGIIPDEELNEKNQLVKQSINFYLEHKFDSYRDSITNIIKHPIKGFSMIEILNSSVQNPKLTNEEQFSEIQNQLSQLPIYFSKAKELITTPDQEVLKSIIIQYTKDYFYLKDELPTLIRKPDILKEDQIGFSQKNEEAQIALKDFIAFLNSHLFEIGDKK